MDAPPTPDARALRAARHLSDEAREVCPILFAAPGDHFQHHTMDANHGDWDPDVFVYKGRTDGSGVMKPGGGARVPAGWVVFRHTGIGRGICAGGCTRGLNGGMLDAIGAWPLDKYRDYGADGTFDENVIALPPKMCWGFRTEDSGEDEESEDEELE